MDDLTLHLWFHLSEPCNYVGLAYTVKKVRDFPFPSRYVTNQTLPARLGTRKSLTFFTVYKLFIDLKTSASLVYKLFLTFVLFPVFNMAQDRVLHHFPK